MATVDPDTLLLMGRIFRAHGIHGEIKVIPETDDPSRFNALEVVFLGRFPEEAQPWMLESVRFQQTKHGVTVVLKLAGISSRDAADALRKVQVYARRSDLPPLAEDEVYVSDVIGLAVVEENGDLIGQVHEVLEMPGHDVYVVAREGSPEVMIPAVPAFIMAVDLDTKQITIRPIEGLLE